MVVYNGRRYKPMKVVGLVALLLGIITIINYFGEAESLEPEYKPVDPVHEKDEYYFMKNLDSMNRITPKGKESVQEPPIPPMPKDHSFLQSMRNSVKPCPDYVEYSQSRHEPYSEGTLKLPFMRPTERCRTFKSSAVEKLIGDLISKVEDPDLARLIENCLPNTLDTTILWHKSTSDDDVDLSQTFVVTGDIHAEWLRDSARQLSLYQPLVKYDAKLKELMKGAINTQAYFISVAPYCNAFHPPPGSNIKKDSSAIDLVFPRPDWRHVFECKWELDSLASFLTLSNEYFENTNDLSFMNDEWLAAFEKLLIVLKRQSVSTFNEEGQVSSYPYTFQRQTNIGSETLPLAGLGNPVNFQTGLIRSAFRPSDDATILQLFIPANAHMYVELKRALKYLTSPTLKKHHDMATKYADAIYEGIYKYGVHDHPVFGKVFAYEVDGYGGKIFMDDANIPSLLSLPDMGFIEKNDPLYVNTRKMILSNRGNPYFLKGAYFEGIGGPHIGIHNAWPMSLLVAIRTSDDEEEIRKSLKLVMETTAGLGLMHESVHVNSKGGKQFTRSWFAWCNSEFGKTILDLAKRKPHLIFKSEYSGTKFDIDQILSS